MLPVPSNDTPPIVLAVANAVAVSALPVTSPVTSPVNVPTNPVAVILPVLGLYVSVPSDSNPRLPPSTSPPAVKTIALFSFVDSLSVIVTVVAIAAVPLILRGGVYVKTPDELLYASAPLPDAEGSEPTLKSVSAIPLPPASSAISQLLLVELYFRILLFANPVVSTFERFPKLMSIFAAPSKD